MPKFQVTFVFNQERMGWSETWYLDQSNYDLALVSATNTATRRSMLLGAGPKLEYIRVSDVLVPGDSKVTKVGVDTVTQTDTADTPWNAIYCRFNAGPLYRRQVWLRGIPDDWIRLINGAPNQNISPAAMNSAFNTFKNYIIAQGYMLKCTKKDGIGGTDISVTGMSADPDGLLRFAVAGGAGNPGDTIRIRKFTGPDSKFLNKIWTVVKNDGVNITVPDGCKHCGDCTGSTT